MLSSVAPSAQPPSYVERWVFFQVNEQVFEANASARKWIKNVVWVWKAADSNNYFITNKPFKLIVIMPNVIMLNVMAPSAQTPSYVERWVFFQVNEQGFEANASARKWIKNVVWVWKAADLNSYFVTNKPFKLSAIRQNGVMLNVVALSAQPPSYIERWVFSRLMSKFLRKMHLPENK